jgi:hypothetical protein
VVIVNLPNLGEEVVAVGKPIKLKLSTDVAFHETTCVIEGVKEILNQHHLLLGLSCLCAILYSNLHFARGRVHMYK